MYGSGVSGRAGASTRIAAATNQSKSIIIMRNLERITLLTATAVYAGYLVKQALRTRSERVYRLAAGESPYERAHPKPRARKALA